MMIDYELFNDYTGLKKWSYRIVMHDIESMILDLNLNYVFEKLTANSGR